jgi:phage-related protein
MPKGKRRIRPKTALSLQELQITTEEKDVIWWPERLKEEIREDWPEPVRKDGGFQLGRVQQGLDPDNYRAMPDIGTGVREIKLQDEDKSQYRLIYTANFEEAVYVFHVITRKKTEKTSKADLEIAKKRLVEIRSHRRKSKKI